MMPSQPGSGRLSASLSPVPCRIIGSGRMAAALSDALQKSSSGTFQRDGIYARSARKAEQLAAGAVTSGTLAELPVQDSNGITLLAVSDAAIPEIAAQLAADGKAGSGLFVHTSGASGLEVLSAIQKAGGRTGSFHPLQSFTDGTGADAFLDISISILCDDDADTSRLSGIARQLGARALQVNARQKKQLHLAAVIASNYMVALLHLAELSASELEEPLLPHFQPLLQQTLHNVMQQGTARALTGPISRGDAGTLRAHLAELDAITLQNGHGATSELIPAYKQLGRVAAELAKADGRLTPEQLSELHIYLKNDR